MKKLKALCLAILMLSPLTYLGYQWKLENEKPPFLTLVGTVKQSDGLGRQSFEMMEALSPFMKVNLLETAPSSFKDVPKKIKKIIKRKDERLGKVVFFTDSIWTPEKAHFEKLQGPKNKDQIRLAYTLFESTEIPSIWVGILNDYFDAAIVPDVFYVNVYKASGVKIPIFTLPLGLNLQNFLAAPQKLRPSKPFTFGFLSACIERKNHMMLIKAFHEVFQGRGDVVLKLNCRYGQEEIICEIKEYLTSNNINNIEFSERCLSSDDYLEYFNSLDCYVSISKGEGFSIQPREALALGIPVIVTNNTAQMTICQSGYVKEVPSFILEPAMRSWGTILKVPEQYGYEFNCKIEDVKSALLEVYSDYPRYLEKAKSAKSWAAQYNLSSLKNYYLALIHPKTVKLANYNTILEDSIITSSPELAKKYQDIILTNSELRDLTSIKK